MRMLLLRTQLLVKVRGEASISRPQVIEQLFSAAAGSWADIARTYMLTLQLVTGIHKSNLQASTPAAGSRVDTKPAQSSRTFQRCFVLFQARV